MTSSRGARRPGPLGLEPALHRTEQVALGHASVNFPEAAPPAAGEAARRPGRRWPSRRRYRQLTTEELLTVLSDAGQGS